MKCIRYGAGYKYQLKADYSCAIEIRPPDRIRTEYIDLDCDGWLTIRKGYAWDGPSGPTIDTDTFMRGSLAHDAAYQLIREGHLPQEARPLADQMLRRICKEDGMWGVRAWWVYWGVRLGAGPAADPAAISPDRFAGSCN